MGEPNDNGAPTWQDQLYEQSYGTGEEVIPVGYDPGEDTIDDVKAYVEANPDDLADVLKAERKGKNRSTLVAWLEES